MPGAPAATPQARVYSPVQYVGHPERVGYTELVATCGGPGIGKTTWAMEWLARSPETRARANRDTLRELVGCMPVGTHEQEGVVTVAQRAMVTAWLRIGLDVAVDDTCSHPSTVEMLTVWAREAGAQLVVVDFVTPVDGLDPLALAIERDRRRTEQGGRHVEEEIIRVIYDRCREVLAGLPAGVEVRRPW